MNKSFLTKMAYSNGLWMSGVLILILAAAGDLVSILSGHFDRLTTTDYGLSETTIPGIPAVHFFQNPYVAHLSRLFLLLGCAMFLQYLSSEYRLIRVRSFFPFFLFCLFSATILPVIPFGGTALSCFFFCWACFRLFGALETGLVNRAAFDASALLAIASLFQSRVLLVLPVFWMVMGIIQVFSFRSFAASFIGALSVFWIIGGLSFLLEDYAFVLAFLRDLTTFQFVGFDRFLPAETAYTVFLGILMISAMFSFWPKQHLDKLRTRNCLNSILLLWFSLLILWLFSGNNMGYLLLLFCLSTPVVAHFFSLVDTRYTRTLLLILVVLSIWVYFLF